MKLCKGQDLSAEELKKFSKILSGNVITRSGRKTLESLDPEQSYTLDDLIAQCGLDATAETPWMSVLKVSDREVAYITSVRRRGEKLLSGKPRIRISTIHKAKGGEADNVALFLDSSKACVESLDQDSEVRVSMSVQLVLRNTCISLNLQDIMDSPHEEEQRTFPA